MNNNLILPAKKILIVGIFILKIQVFERIKAAANADMVSKVKACYVFELEGGDGKYYIDLKEGDGQVGEGEVPNKPDGFKPEVKITMSQENMLKMFNSKLALKLLLWCINNI